MKGLPPLPSFDDFYQAVHNRRPFPWQSRLARAVEDGGWPAEIGVPTGLGKTSTIDIGIWALAADAGRNPAQRRAATRLWYVVDRRLLIDAATDHAVALASRLEDPGAPEEVAAVAVRLRSLGAVSGRPALHVTRLRGGVTPDLIAPDPAQPAVICATVDMFASRLLMRGYGVSPAMWPIHAAHAGIDTLVLLDEAHLAVPLVKMLGTLPACDANQGVLRFPGRFTTTPGPEEVLGGDRARPRLVTLTATGHAVERFELDDSDRSHPVVARRLSAAKPTGLVETTVAELSDTLAETTVALMDEVRTATMAEPAVLVFVNSPSTARQVATKLRRTVGGSGAEVVTLTGQLRDPDAERVRDRLLDPSTGCPSGGAPTRSAPLIVVATQTLEVGADLDADVLISETAGVRAITQRWGRLNRLGERPWAKGVLVHPVDRRDSGLYGDEPDGLWARLTGHGDGLLDLGPGRIAAVLGEPAEPDERTGELLGVHMWEFAKTSSRAPDAAPPEVFFRPLSDGSDRRVAVVWRVIGPPVGFGPGHNQPIHRLVAPVRTAESVDVPIGELVKFIDKMSGVDLAWVVEDDQTLRPVESSESVRPGQTVVLSVTAGGYTESGWDPDANATVTDLGPVLGGRMWVTVEAFENLLGRPLSEGERSLIESLELGGDEVPDPEVDEEAGRQLDMLLRGQPGFDAIREVNVERIGSEQVPVLSWRSGSRRPTYAVDALDELSNTPRAGLVEHLGSVGELAGRIAAQLGLPEPLVTVVKTAGRFHDLGKADARFQRRLGNTDPATPPVAKSGLSPGRFESLGRSSGWPQGGRHELLSVQLIDAALAAGLVLDDEDLIRHLVLSHHGHGRPTCPTAGEGALLTVLSVSGTEFRAFTDPSAEDLGQPERFRVLCERFGYWGLCLLEAIVRQADHVVSRATDVPSAEGEVVVV